MMRAKIAFMTARASLALLVYSLSFSLCFGFALVPLGALGDEAPQASLGRLELVIEGFPDDRGVARIQLARGEAEYESGKTSFRQADAPITGGRARWTFEGLPPGDFAIRVFHDANDNGKLDTNWMKVPKEFYGFSNDPPRRLGPARYEDASFQISSETRRLEIHLLAPPF